jgi:quercetin dioxygenase-like cupin family protein
MAALVCGLLIGGVMSSPASAQGSPATEKKEAYVSPGADKRGLINEPLHGVAGQQVSVDHYTFPPGWVGGRHYHTGPVYVYVLEGSLTMDEHGKARQTFKPGDLYREPIGTPMQARNLSAVEPLKALVIQVTRKGEPLMIKAD